MKPPPSQICLVGCLLAAILATVSSAGASVAQATAELRHSSAFAAGSTRQPLLDQHFNGVDGIAPDDIWAIGQYGETTLARHWDGTRWRFVSVGMAGNLLDVDAVSSDDVWAVGEQPYGSGTEVLIVHWNGTAWTEVPAPHMVCQYADLYDVSDLSADQVLATGLCGNGEESNPISFLWDGSSWQTSGSDYTYIYDLDGKGSDGWAVGGVWFGNSVAKHWNGHRWKLVDTPNYPGGDSDLGSVDQVSPVDVWVIGRKYTDLPHIFSEHWNGRRWKLIDSDPAMNDEAHPQGTGMTALRSGQAWMSGLYSYPISEGFIQHWDGHHWSFQKNPAQNIANSRLDGIKAFSDRDVWAVGSSYGGGVHQPLLLHWNGHRWARAPKNW